MTDLPIDPDKFKKLAEQEQDRWNNEFKPLWDDLNRRFPVDLDNAP